MAMLISTLVVVWFHREGHRSVQFPFRPWYPKKVEPSFADMLTTLRRLSYDEKTAGVLLDETRLETWIAQLTELLSRTGRLAVRPRIPRGSAPSRPSRRDEIPPPDHPRYALILAKQE